MEIPLPCNCPGPGWCERFGKYQTGHLWQLCRCDARYRRIWEDRKAQRNEDPDQQAGDRKPASNRRRGPCIYLGSVLDRLDCNCPRRWIRACEVHDRCTIGNAALPLAQCHGCPDYEADVVAEQVGVEFGTPSS